MKVKFIAKRYPARSQTFVQRQVSGLIELGHDVDVHAWRKNARHGSPEGEEPGRGRSGERVVDGLKGLWFLASRMMAAPSEVRGLIGSGRSFLKFTVFLGRIKDPASVTHVHFGTLAAQLFPVLKLSTGPIVVSFYGNDASGHARRNPGMYSELFRDADRVVALSEYMVQQLTGLGCERDKIRIVPLPVDVKLYRPGRTAEPRDVVRLLSVCRLVEKKGIDTAISAVASLHERDDYRFRYEVVGDGPLSGRLKELVRRSGLQDVVRFTGWADPRIVARKMRESDIFLHPSVTASDGDEEGTPTAILEAQASGMPVVSTRHAGIPEIVSNECGILVDEKDDAGIRDALRRLMDDEALRVSMGKRGREYVETRHSESAVARELESLYRSCVDGG